MSNIKILNIDYEESKTIERQGKQSDMKKFIKEGFSIVLYRNGYCVLNKPACAIVTIDDSNDIKKLYMKELICDYYERKNISEKLVNKFKSDIDNGSITIQKQLNNNYFLQ